MPELIAWLGIVVPVFLLILARTAGLMLQAPILSNKNIPQSAKMTIAVSLSIVIMTTLSRYPHVPDTLLPFLLMIMTEIVLGALFGFASGLMFHAIQAAGEMAGVQAGMSFASTMNPLLKSNVNPFGTLYYQVGVIIFLMIGGHLWLIGGFAQSFKLVPMGTFILTPALSQHIILASSTFLALTIQLAMPAVIALFLTDMCVGYISKAAPQATNILELVQAIKPIAGLVLLLLLIPNLMSMTHTQAEFMIRDLDKFLRIAGQR
jgi:flagellar biosynthetic protein FliR